MPRRCHSQRNESFPRASNAARIHELTQFDCGSTRIVLPVRLPLQLIVRAEANASLPRVLRLACWLACSLGLAWPGWTSAADQKPAASPLPVAKTPVSKPKVDRFRQVELMSEPERERLQRNIAEFQQLTPDQQAHYRELHLKLEENKASGGPLAPLLNEYIAWLNTLTPSQRDELSQELEPARKVALVTKFKREQEARYESAPADSPEGPSGDQRPFPRRGMVQEPFFAKPELQAVMKVIAKDADIERDRSNNEPLLSFYLVVMQTSIKLPPGGPREWPGRELMLKIEAAIERPEQRHLLQRNPDYKRQTLIQFIVSGIVNQAIEEMKAMRPTPDERQRIFDVLEQSEREKLLRLPPPRQEFELERRFYAGRNDNPRERLRDMEMKLDKICSDLGVPRPQRPPGGDGGRPGGPGPFSRDRMPDGPDGGRPPRNGNGPDRPRRPGE